MKTKTQTQPKTAKPKKVAYRYIRPEEDVNGTLYGLLKDLVLTHHEELRDARIALAWQLSWRPDADGRVTLGQAKKVSDLERELLDTDGQPFDFVILLRKDFWQDPRVTPLQRRALLDHELCHCAPKLDADDEQVVDECGRLVWRLRRHDLEEFAEIAERYGCWKRDLEAFAAAIDKARDQTHTWTGYSRVRDELAAAGVMVPLERIIEWTEAQRREAEVWALVEAELRRNNLEDTIDTTCPPHVAPFRRSIESTPEASTIETVTAN